jgi:hypothetical protein
MSDHDRLSSLILAHWTRYHPKMLRELQQQDRLQQVLEETAERFADLLYDLVSVRKMEYHQAWELAIREILLLERSWTSSHKQNPPATSE